MCIWVKLPKKPYEVGFFVPCQSLLPLLDLGGASSQNPHQSAEEKYEKLKIHGKFQAQFRE